MPLRIRWTWEWSSASLSRWFRAVLRISRPKTADEAAMNGATASATSVSPTSMLAMIQTMATMVTSPCAGANSSRSASVWMAQLSTVTRLSRSPTELRLWKSSDRR